MKFLEATLGWVIIISFVLSISAQACPQNVQKLKTGTSSPCDGWLVSEPKMQELAKNADELELSRKLVLAQEHLRKLDLGEIEHYKSQSKAAHKALSQSENQRVLVGIGAFVLGVVVTGFAAKAAIEATR
jgi:hypothetical protein